jgi:serine/threonine-protein kinase
MGSTAQAIVAKVITEHAPPVTAARDTVPANVAAAVDKALAKLPADRFASAAQLAEALVSPGFTNARTRAEAAVSAPAPARRGLQVAVVVAVLATGLALWGWLRPRPQPTTRVSRLAVALPEEQALQRTAVGYRFALSPDGTSLVYTGPGAGTPMLWLRRFDQLNASPLAGTEGGFNPAFSHDGQSIIFLTEQPRALKLVSLSSGSVITVADSGLGVGGAALGDDGYIYVDVDAGGLARLPEAGGDYEPVTQLARDSGEVGVAWPVAVPGGDVVLYRMRYSGSQPAEWDIKATSLSTGESKVVTRGIRAQYVSPGYLVYATGDGRLMSAPFDTDRMELTGPARAVVEGLGVGVYGVTDFAVADNGTLVYLVGGQADVRSEVLVINETGEARPFFDGWRPGQWVWWVAPDPAMQRVALVMARDGSTEASDIFVKSVGPTLPVRLTFDGSFNGPARWSPDGRWIYYLSDREGTLGVYRKRADGSGGTERIDLPPFTPTGPFDVGVHGGELWLVLTIEGPEDEGDIVAIRPDVDTAFTPLLIGPQWHSQPTTSPDGRWIAYSAGDADERVYVRPFPNVQDGHWQVSESFGEEPTWSPDGTRIYYRDSDGDLTAVDLQTEPGFAVISRGPAFGESPAFWTLGATFVPIGNREVMVVGAQGGGVETGQLIVVQGFGQELRGPVR